MIKEYMSSVLERYPELHSKAKDLYGDLRIRKNLALAIPKQMFLGSKNMSLVDKVLLHYPMIHSGMVSKNELKVILTNLDKVLKNGIEGDVVELGCNVGTTSLFIRKLLNEYQSKKEFHVYDSWEGLPDKTDKDVSPNQIFEKGSCKTSKEKFIHHFDVTKLELPGIHSGWFKKIPDAEYPKKIAFAFLDGDFYNSILDSFLKIYFKLVPGAIVAVHDYGILGKLQGVKQACIDYLKRKPEEGTMTDQYNIGIMIKQ